MKHAARTGSRIVPILMARNFSKTVSTTMKVFHCDHCDQLVFFENTVCVKCGNTLAYLPDLGDMGVAEPRGSGSLELSPAQGGRKALSPL